MSDPKELKKRFGPLAKKVHQRMKELEAARDLSVLGTLPGMRCHELKGDRKGQLSINISGNQRLFFEPDQETIPEKEDGGLDWERVEKVKVLEVEDPH